MSETTENPSLPGVVKLSRPVQMLDGEITELKLREPNGNDLAECGYPLRFTPDGSFEFLAKPMTALIARLAGVPLTTVQSLRAGEWSLCAGVIGGFLGAGAGGS